MPRRVVLYPIVHVLDAPAALKKRIEDELRLKVVVPKYLEKFEL